MEQIRLENEQIEVTVNIHGAELRSLKSKADGQDSVHFVILKKIINI